jgi:hypothetical protein
MPREAATLAVCLTKETPATLSALARLAHCPGHHIERSAIILHLADQRGTTEIAANAAHSTGHPLRPPGQSGGTAQRRR